MFQVSGWSLPSKVAVDEPKKNSKKQKKEKKEKKEKLPKEPQPESQNKEKSKKRKRNDKDESDIKVDKKAKEASKPTEVSKPEPKLTPMQQKMKEKLTGSRFRWINEQLYTIKSEEAVKLIEENPEMFDEYHNGFRSQVHSWPENPVDTFIKQVKQRLEKPVAAPGGMPGEKDGNIVIADMGCGEAQLALEMQSVKGHGKSKKAKFEVHSFDLKQANDRITVADIKNVPLKDESCHVVVFCLALMGTNFLDFIKEGIRILKPNGEIWIAEIKSRFVESDYSEFVQVLKAQGLFHKTTDDSNKMFVRFEFFKPPKDLANNSKKKKFIEQDDHEGKAEGEWLLKPCVYKKR